MTPTPTYLITIILAVGPDADEHLPSIRGIADEITSWLSDLGANVQSVIIEPIVPTRTRTRIGGP
jgi:hypothetical protein